MMLAREQTNKDTYLGNNVTTRDDSVFTSRRNSIAAC